MTDFTDFNLIFDNLVAYFTGSYEILALTLIGLFLVTLLVAGIELRYSIVFGLPLAAFFVAIGWFGVTGSWIVNLGLIIVSVFYAFAILRMTS